MDQEELLKAIREQTEAIDRQTATIERLARYFERVFGSGIEMETAKTVDMTPEQRKENAKRVLAELNAAQKLSRK
jgi:hypothetical protein